MSRLIQFYLTLLLHTKSTLHLWACAGLGAVVMVGYFLSFEGGALTHLLYFYWLVLVILAQGLGYGVCGSVFDKNQDHFLSVLCVSHIRLWGAKIVALGIYMSLFLSIANTLFAIVLAFPAIVGMSNLVLMPFFSFYIASYLVLFHQLSSHSNTVAHLMAPFWVAPLAVILKFQEELAHNKIDFSCLLILIGLTVLSISMTLLAGILKGARQNHNL